MNGTTRTAAQATGLTAAGPEQAAVAQREVGAVAAAARELALLRAAYEAAWQRPRSEAAARERLLQACSRPSFAEACVWSFPRGEEVIEGPSVQLAREAARCWTNLRYGLMIVSEDDERVHVQGWALDVEGGVFAAAEDKFRKLIQRKVGEGRARKSVWIVPDERDLRELVNRRGAILVRNCLLQVLPAELIEAAVQQAQGSMRSAAEEAAKSPQVAAGLLAALLKSFEELGVSAGQIQARIGRPVAEITAAEVVELRKVYRSVRDGNSRAEEHFQPAEAPAAAKPEAKTLDDLAADELTF